MNDNNNQKKQIAEVLILNSNFSIKKTYSYSIPAEIVNSVKIGSLVNIKYRNLPAQGIVLSKQTGQKLDDNPAESLFDFFDNDTKLNPIISVISNNNLIDEHYIKIAKELAEYWGVDVCEIIELAIPNYMVQADKIVSKYFEDKGSSKAKEPSEKTVKGRSNALDGLLENYNNSKLLLDNLQNGTPTHAVWNLNYEKITKDGYTYSKYFHEIAQLAMYVSNLNKKILIIAPDQREVDFIERSIKTFAEQSLVNLKFWDIADRSTKNRYKDDSEPFSYTKYLEGGGDDKPAQNVDKTAYIDNKSRAAGETPVEDENLENSSNNQENNSSPIIYAKYHSKMNASLKYTTYLGARNGEIDIIVGTRSAALLPVKDLGLTIILDDASNTYKDPKKPYMTTRELLVLRSTIEKTSLLIASHVVSPQSISYINKKWAFQITPKKTFAPKTYTINSKNKKESERNERIPNSVFNEISEALKKGTVLVQAPKAGYVNVLRCVRCNEIVRCDRCYGAMYLSRDEKTLKCSTCGAIKIDFRCKNCGCTRYKFVQKGIERIVEELGKTFRKTSIFISTKERKIIDELECKPHQLVVATPNCEPKILKNADGYELGVILDAYNYNYPFSNGNNTVLNTWMSLSSLVKQDGKVYLLGDVEMDLLRAFIKSSPYLLAESDYNVRKTLDIPPFCRMLSIAGTSESIKFALDRLKQDKVIREDDILGPVDLNDLKKSNMFFFNQMEFIKFSTSQKRVIVKTEGSKGRELAKTVKRIRNEFSIKYPKKRLILNLDPIEFL